MTGSQRSPAPLQPQPAGTPPQRSSPFASRPFELEVETDTAESHRFRSTMGMAASAGTEATPSSLQWNFANLRLFPAQSLSSPAGPLIQRDLDGTETAEAEDSETTDIDAELEALLQEVFGATPEVPTFEAITSTTAGEYSRGELESEIQRLWRRERLSFTAGARRTAREDSDRRPRSTQSAESAPDSPYSQRWSLNFYAADYQGTRSDLPDITDLLRRGSPFQRAIAEESFDQVIPVSDPTGDQMRDRMYATVEALWLALDSSQIGELVVSFSGHGGNGAINGVDWGVVTAAEMAQIAQFARDFNIHIIYILDTCRAGLLTSYAQAAAIEDIEADSAELSEDDRLALQPTVAAVRQLGSLSAHLSGRTIAVGDAARAFHRRDTDANFIAYFRMLQPLTDEANALRTFLEGESPAIAAIPNRDVILQKQNDLLGSILLAFAGSRSGVNALLRDCSELLDEMSEAINTMTIGLQSSAGGAAADASS